MELEVEIIPCYSEHGHTVTIIIKANDGHYLEKDEIAMALADYAEFLVNEEPEEMN